VRVEAHNARVVSRDASGRRVGRLGGHAAVARDEEDALSAAATPTMRERIKCADGAPSRSHSTATSRSAPNAATSNVERTPSLGRMYTTFMRRWPRRPQLTTSGGVSKTKTATRRRSAPSRV
jgi:hypothetical protein